MHQRIPTESSDMDGLNQTTKDMFSWLLYSSENIVAPSHGSVSIEDKTQTQKPDHMNVRATSMDLFHTTTPENATTSPVLLSGPLSPSNLQEKCSNEPMLSSIDTLSSQIPILKPQASDITLTDEAKQIDFTSTKKRVADEMNIGQVTTKVSTNLLKKQKLERNRESARECRRRKREHMLSVEERCRKLERENMELRGQLKAGKEAMKTEEREKNRVCEELEKMIQSGASEKELAEKIDKFKEQYSDYGHGRRSALSYHLRQIERLLLPTQVTKMCIWALRQDDSFWQDEEDETSLPVILGRELGLSDDQKKKIQSHRGSITSICENLQNALALLSDLKTQVENKNSTLDSEMDKLQNILTPTQRAKFIVWVTNNPACMHLLNKLWRSVV